MTPQQQMLHDILCTAIEGGIDYWAQITGTGKSQLGTPDWDYEWARIFDPEEEQEYTVTTETIKLGMDRILEAATIAASRYADAIRHAMLEPEDNGVWIDADVADIIVQVGVFGKVVYS